MPWFLTNMVRNNENQRKGSASKGVEQNAGWVKPKPQGSKGMAQLVDEDCADDDEAISKSRHQSSCRPEQRMRMKMGRKMWTRTGIPLILPAPKDQFKTALSRSTRQL